MKVEQLDLSRVFGAREGRLLHFDDGVLMAVIEWEPESFDLEWEQPGNDLAICDAIDRVLDCDWSYSGGRALNWPELGCVREEILLKRKVRVWRPRNK